MSLAQNANTVAASRNIYRYNINASTTDAAGLPVVEEAVVATEK